MTTISQWLKNLTMYQLMQYFLIVLVAEAIGLSAVHLLPFNPIALTIHVFVAVGGAMFINWLLAWLLRAPTNPDTAVITGLIISLIVGPVALTAVALLKLIAIVALAIGSKFLITYRGRHIFNPAAFGVFAGALLVGLGASWWVGTPILVVTTLLIGLYVASRLRQLPLVLSFIGSYLLFNAIWLLVARGFNLALMETTFVVLVGYTALLFLAFVMLVEPATSPVKKKYNLYYALIVAGGLVLLQQLWPNLLFSFELALLIGNVYARLTKHDQRWSLKLTAKHQLAPNIWEFLFTKPAGFQFQAGQYLHWTLPHAGLDSRGNRRYFTIAASPTEKELRLVTKLAEASSSFKTALQQLEVDQSISAWGLGGDFVLPEADQPLVFIAGGIGITPFIAMIKYLVDKNRKQQVTLLYSAKTPAEFIFRELFDEAAKKIGLKTVYVATEPAAHWAGETGFINEALIKKHVPELTERIVYVSGPEPMVESFEKMLTNMGVADTNLKRDYFPGYTETYTAG